MPVVRPHWRAMLLLFVSLTLGVTIWRINAALDGLWKWSSDEVARVTSPSGRFDAVLMETNGGATTSYGYEIHVLPSGADVNGSQPGASLYGAVRSQSAYGLNLRWVGTHLVRAEYLTAQMEKNLGPVQMGPGGAVAIELRSGVADPHALPGGMLRNKHDRPAR